MILGLHPYSYRDAVSKNLKVTTPKVTQRSIPRVIPTSVSVIIEGPPPEVVHRSALKVTQRSTPEVTRSEPNLSQQKSAATTAMDLNRSAENNPWHQRGHQIFKMTEAQRRAREDALEATYAAMLTSPDREVSRRGAILLAQMILDGIKDGRTTSENVTSEREQRKLFTDWRQK